MSRRRIPHLFMRLIKEQGNKRRGVIYPAADDKKKTPRKAQKRRQSLGEASNCAAGIKSEPQTKWGNNLKCVNVVTEAADDEGMESVRHRRDLLLPGGTDTWIHFGPQSFFHTRVELWMREPTKSHSHVMWLGCHCCRQIMSSEAKLSVILSGGRFNSKTICCPEKLLIKCGWQKTQRSEVRTSR